MGIEGKIADLIQLIIYLLPLGGLVWKFAEFHASLKLLIKRVDELEKLTEHEHSERKLMQEKLEMEIDDEKNATDSSIATLMSMVYEIKTDVGVIKSKL